MKKRNALRMAAAVVLVNILGCNAFAQGAAEIDIETLEAMKEEVSLSEGITYNCDYFSVTIPQQLDAIAKVKAEANRIAIYDSASLEAGYGGFVFEISVFDKKEEYAPLPSYTPFGTVTSSDGITRHVILQYPTDVQFNYESKEAVENYHMLYENVELITSTLAPAEGFVYASQAAFDNTHVYDAVLENLIAALSDQSDIAALDEAGFSYLYMYQYDRDSILDAIGYAYLDINGDGYKELALGSMDENDDVVYDLFTTINEKPERVFSSRERDRFYITADGYTIREEGSSSAFYSWVTYYLLNDFDAGLCEQSSYVCDAQADPDNPYFYDPVYMEELIPISEEEWCERINLFPGVRVQEMRPLSEF